MEASSEVSLLGENNLLVVARDEDSGSDNFHAGSGDEHEVNEGGPQRRRKRYHRHTPQQIQELETFFKECPHPDEKQRKDLSRRLGLENKQVKFWFQNRRTQMKTQIERHENMMLRQENEKLRAENTLMKESVANPTCKTCGGPSIPGQISFEDHQVRIENARLKEELARTCAITQKFIGRPLSSLVGPFPHQQQQSPSSAGGMELGVGMNGLAAAGPSNHAMLSSAFGLGLLDMGINNSVVFSSPPPQSDAVPLIRTPNPMAYMMGEDPNETAILLQLAFAAAEELIKLAQPENPLWVRSSDGMREVLNVEDYMRVVPPCLGPRPIGFVSEATRESGLVLANCMTVVDTLMNADQWAEIFPSLVARALPVHVMPGDMNGSKNGALDVVHAEVQLPSPLVPVRQMTFLRFCRQIGEGLWAVVDVSVDIGPNLFGVAHPFMNCRRLPSGCIVQDTSSGISKVTWIEHNQYDESVIHQLYRPLVYSGIGFGAQRWVASLQRHFEYVSSITNPSLTPGDPTGMTLAGRRGMVKLAQRVTNSFFSGVCPSAAHEWEPLAFEMLDDNMKMMARKSGHGEPAGLVLSAATSVWVPVAHQTLFDYLRDERSRLDWDIMAENGPVEELFHIPKGQGNGNAVSVLRPGVNRAENSVLILQDAFTDNTSSVIVYVAMDMDTLNLVMNGGESVIIGALPSGFVIHPDGRGGGSSSSSSAGGDVGGSFLTVGLQILLNAPNTRNLSMESVISVNNLISDAVRRIKVALRVA